MVPSIQSRRGRIYCLAFLLLFFNIYAKAQDWIWQNPLPQGNHLYSIATLTPRSAITVGTCGTVLKSTNGGASWSASYRIASFAGTFRSISAVDSNTAWVVGDSGIVLLTVDGGNSWRRLATVPNSHILYSVHFFDKLQGWVVGDSCSIFHTTNGGRSWIDQSIDSKNILRCIVMVDALTGWAVGSGGAILRTSNGGVRWNVVDTGLLTNFSSAVFMDSDTGWIGGSGGILIRTTDRGTTWNRVPSGTSQAINSLTYISPGFSYGVAQGTFITSTNFGQTWIGSAINAQSVYYAVSFGDSERGFTVGYAGDISQTSDGGRTWIQRSNGITKDINSLTIIDTNIVVAAGDNGTLLRTSNGGIVFSLVAPLGLTSSLNAVQFSSSTFGWAVGSLGAIIATQNGGLTWTEQHSGTNQSLLCASAIDKAIVWTGGDKILLRTTNGGTSWEERPLPDSTALISTIHFVDQDRGEILASRLAGGITRILKTTDGGVTWSGREEILAGSMRSMFFLNVQVGWAVGNGNTILKSLDGGISWIPGSLPLNKLYNEVFFADELNGWVGSSNGIILRTTDGGTRWSEITTNSSYTISRIKFYDDSTGWVVGAAGMILKTTNGGGVGQLLIRPHSTPPPTARKAELTNFPNPFSDSTWIPFELTSKSDVTVKIFDGLGVLLREYDLGALPKGTYDNLSKAVLWDGRDRNNFRMSSGIYFYEIITAYGETAGKMILVR